MNRDSDLIVIPYILGIILAVAVVMAAFFVIGDGAGIALLVIAMLAIAYVAFRGLSAKGSK